MFKRALQESISWGNPFECSPVRSYESGIFACITLKCIAVFTYFQLWYFFLEQNITFNASTKTAGDQLYISWNVNTRLPYGDDSSQIYFQVKYCPLNFILEPQDCRQVSITLCKANYQRLHNASSSITAEKKELADYIRDANPRIPLFEKNSSVNIRGEWNETSSAFICAVHIDECAVAYHFPTTKGQVLIIASVTNYTEEKVLLDIKQNKGLF